MNKTLLCWSILVGCVFASAAAAQSTGPGAESHLTKEQIKVVDKARKQLKDFPLWLTVEDVQVDHSPTQVVAAIGTCTGSLTWIFCSSAPITTGGDSVEMRVKWDGSEEEFQMDCGADSRCVSLAPGRYPAKKVSAWRWPYNLVVLANVNDRVKKIYFHEKTLSSVAAGADRIAVPPSQ